jgi:hypothetical protein
MKILIGPIGTSNGSLAGLLFGVGLILITKLYVETEMMLMSLLEF